MTRSDADIAILPTDRLGRSKRAYSVRRVDVADIQTVLSGRIAPEPGDLVLASVNKIGQHRKIELGTGRRAELHPGDEVVLAYGNRYAPDQFEAIVPDTLGTCSMVAAGGIAARVLESHQRMRRATEIKPIGILGSHNGNRINLRSYGVSHSDSTPDIPVIAVVGTSMNAGKTATAARIVRGLHLAGNRVGAVKVTGTGAGGDVWQMWDAGCVAVADFTDAGFASTYRLEAYSIEQIFTSLLTHVAAQDVDVLVVEIADGLLQSETANLMTSRVFRETADLIVLAAADAAGAWTGSEWLRARDLPLAILSGVFTSSPLAIREARKVIDVSIVETDKFAETRCVQQFWGSLINGDRSPVRVDPTEEMPIQALQQMLRREKTWVAG